jgi:hypothetical protein
MDSSVINSSSEILTTMHNSDAVLFRCAGFPFPVQHWHNMVLWTQQTIAL